MNISGKGITIIIVFLVVIPALVDLLLLPLFLPGGVNGYSMSRSLFAGYGRMIPYYIGYLVVAFTILYLINQWQQRRSNKK
jgi:large-conductance mechanosensitive channel